MNKKEMAIGDRHLTQPTPSTRSLQVCSCKPESRDDSTRTRTA
ncbi:hypothetical protein [Microcoleus sp. FACHB-831]|nr:hypothetical protein [Microcoleus sp. FACHB-831]